MSGQSGEIDILIIDDEPDQRGLLGVVVERIGLQPHLAGGGQQALELVESGLEPNLVLLDLEMPGMDGIETIEALEKGDIICPVLMITAAYDDLTPKQAAFLQSHGVPVVGQPYGVKELQTTIKQTLGLE